MSEMIKINTEDLVKYDTQLKPFNLVSENDSILKKLILHFDFDNVPCDPNLFASRLVETCKSHHGYGLSANQCGFEYNVFVMGAADEYVAFFNPMILEFSKEQDHAIEGCLSFPFLGLRISRPRHIVVEYQDFNGKKHHTPLSGLSARYFQHQFDLLNGILYTTRAKPLALQQGLKKRNKLLQNLRIK